MSELITGGMLIGGDLVQARSGRTFPTRSPTTTKVIGHAPEADHRDVDRAVASAQEAFPEWARKTPRERSSYLTRLAAKIAERKEELAWLDTMDSGNPLWAMKEDVDRTVNALEFYASLASAISGSTIPASSQHLHYTQLEPFGVVARIVPYNHPILFAATRIAAPLLAGNSVIMKTAPQTPLSALLLGEIAREIFPAGVVNLLTGGIEAGQALATHPEIRRLSVIGSLKTGLAVQGTAAASGTLKDITYELGGKNAMMLFEDVDVEVATNAVVSGMNLERCGGQSCGSTSRVFVHDSIADDVIERVAERFSAMQVGDPLDDTTQMGPMISEEHLLTVLDKIEAGRQTGAAIVTGGRRVDRPGHFLEPTVLSEVDPRSVLGREEVFGPVVGFTRWTDPTDMLRMVNDSNYGLTASIWTDDLQRAHEFASRVNAGYVWVNTVERRWPGIPWGGVRNSGLGREYCVEEVLSYTQIKAVNVSLANRAGGPSR